jgi:guanosine-3',5'-bis(diphosphate) 3'-pyrophosphohydrolase
VHTVIGNTCVACRIDRRLAPLSATLESGQTVEIITAPGASPNPAWLSFVITGKARGGIRHALKNQQRNESLALGRRLLERTLKAHKSSVEAIQPARLHGVLAERNMTNLDQLLEAIGLGNQMASVVARRLVTTVTEDIEDTRVAEDHSLRHSPLPIKGTEGMVVTYARCCRPIPGDPIIGHISAGKGIVIHMETCRNMSELRGKREETMSVRWDPAVTQEFSVELRVELEHEKGIVATLAATSTNADANVERISMMERDAHLSTVNLVLSVRDRVHLAKVIKRLRIIKGVNKITRVRS